MKRMTIVLMLMAAVAAAAAEPPEVRMPREGQRIGADGDDACPAGRQCWQIHAEGSVPRGHAGIFAVEPLNASPTIWIQNFPPGSAGGNVSASIYLGNVRVGAKEYFRIYLLSCEGNHGLKAGETTIEEIPPVCEISAPVTVFRER